MTKVQITKSMLDQLEYDTVKMSLDTGAATTAKTTKEMPTPTVMFVFAGADLNAAAYHLAKSMETPFADSACATLLLQESVYDDFIQKVQAQLPVYDVEQAQHNGYTRALDTVSRLQARTVMSTKAQVGIPATLVHDFTHEQLGADITGLVTVHTFRTAKEAIALCAKESLAFASASIWNENFSCAYELVAAVGCRNFYINCFQVSMEPLRTHIDSNSIFVIMDKSYHYETLQCNGMQKSVVFPIGTIFAN